MALGTVIVGGGVGGLRCAERLRRAGDLRPITILDSEGLDAYDRPALSKAVLSSADDPALPVLRGGAAAELAAADIVVRSAVRAESLHLGRREIVTTDGERLAFEHLVIATGAAARALPGLAADNVLLLRTWSDAVRLRAALRSAGTVVIIGAGVLGLEVAAGARHGGAEVHVVDLAPRTVARLGSRQLGDDLERLHTERGVTFHLGTSVTGSDRQGDRIIRLDLADGTVLAPDVVVVAVGTTPNTGWIADSGLRIDNGVVCDATTRSSDPRVFAIGDAARIVADGLPDERFEHWTRAVDTAAVAARTIAADVAGGSAAPLTELPYVWTDQYEHKVQLLGTLGDDCDLTTVIDRPDPRQVLQVAARGTIVVGVVGWNLPAAVNRCRPFIERHATVEDLLQAQPWQRKAAGA